MYTVCKRFCSYQVQGHAFLSNCFLSLKKSLARWSNETKKSVLPETQAHTSVFPLGFFFAVVLTDMTAVNSLRLQLFGFHYYDDASTLRRHISETFLFSEGFVHTSTHTHILTVTQTHKAANALACMKESLRVQLCADPHPPRQTRTHTQPWLAGRKEYSTQGNKTVFIASHPSGIQVTLNPYLLLDKVYIVSTQEIMHFDSINMIL